MGEGTVDGGTLTSSPGATITFEGVEYQTWDKYMTIELSPVISPLE